MRWTLVIPVKPAAVGKSRLGASPAVARAIALDTVTAASQAADVVVVTGDAELAGLVAGLARVVLEQQPRGIAAALEAGFAGMDADSARGALLGDLPALDPADLVAALALAEGHPGSFVPDAEGSGTTLVTALPGAPFRARFGDGSARAHRVLGLAELPVPPTSTLRRDVDTPAHLDALSRAGLLAGRATERALLG